MNSDALPQDKMMNVLDTLNKFDHVNGAEVYELALPLIQASHRGHFCSEVTLLSDTFGI